MKGKYYPPKFEADQFHCPRCSVFASQIWRNILEEKGGGRFEATDFRASVCVHCREASYWQQGRLIDPGTSTAEPPHPDLPQACLADYREARDIVGRSPRGAAALLRVALQKLMSELGESGRNINDDIKSLVSKGLPAIVQQALDFARVVGNNAVHPGEIDVNDNPEIAAQLFTMINFIVEDRITRPKEVQGLYDQLPKGVRDAIAKRDAPKRQGS